jgi:hypothetical protein
MKIRLDQITLTPTMNGWYLEATAIMDECGVETSFVIEDAKESHTDLPSVVDTIRKNPGAFKWYIYNRAGAVNTEAENEN